MINFTVRPDGQDEFKVTATSRDVALWERSGRDRSFTRLMSELPLADLYRVAHLAATRLGHWSGSLAAFESACDLIFAAPQVVTPDPSQPAP